MFFCGEVADRPAPIFFCHSNLCKMAVDESGDSRRRPLRLRRGGLKAEGCIITREGGLMRFYTIDFQGAVDEGGYWGDCVSDEHVRKSDENVVNVILYI